MEKNNDKKVFEKSVFGISVSARVFQIELRSSLSNWSFSVRSWDFRIELEFFRPNLSF